MENDQKLIQRFLTGDETALEILLKRYLSPVYNFLYQLTREQNSLDDLTQETFIKAWKNLSHFDQKKNFKTWLFPIAKKPAYDYLRKKKAVPFSFFSDAEGYNPLENIPTESILPDEILARKDLAKELEQKLNQLSPAYQLILRLRYQEDFSLQEIAKILNIPYNTVKSQHNRAIKALKGQF